MSLTKFCWREQLETYTTNEEYVRVSDNVIDYFANEQRVCWEYRRAKRQRSEGHLTKASPIHDFRPLKLGFEGVASATGVAPLQNLIIQPHNYLSWDEDENKVCLNILQDTSSMPAFMLGAQVMREQLFVFDVENRRVRWKASSTCEV